MNVETLNKTHNPSLFQFILNILALLSAWGLAFLLFIFGLLSLIAPADADNSPVSMMSMAAVMAAIGFCFIPSIVFSWKRMRGKPVRNQAFTIHPVGIGFILIWPALVYGGSMLEVDTVGRMILFPIIHVFSVLIPIIALFWLGSHRLVSSSHQRNAGLLSTGLAVGTTFSLILETAVLIIAIVLLILVVLANPQLNLELSRFSERINAVNMDLVAIRRIMGPYVSSPLIISLALGFFSVLTPLIEETCKPIGLWFFARRNLSPQDGFIGGMLSGAGFTIFETMFSGYQVESETWLFVMVLRIGAGALHILASGLVGYSLVKAWNTHKYLPLFVGFMTSVILHGIWNMLAIFMSMAELVPDGSDSFLINFRTAGPYALSVMSLLLITGLFLINRKLYNQQQAELLQSTPAVPEG